MKAIFVLINNGAYLLLQNNNTVLLQTQEMAKKNRRDYKIDSLKIVLDIVLY